MGDGGDRLERAQQAMVAAGVEALLVGPGADLRYLTGYAAMASERLTLLVARADGHHRLIVPTLERPRAEAAELPAAVELVDVGETTDPFAVAAAALDGQGASPHLGVGDQLWSFFLLGLQARLPGASWQRASVIIRELRMRKDPGEVDALRRAGQAIDRVHARVPEVLKAGRSEKEVGRDIADLIVEEGHDQAGFVIVGSGPNGASPHHETSDRVIGEGEAVVVDIGGPLDGYWSDCTRDYVLGDAPDGYDDAHGVLEQAQQAAFEHVRPGVSAASVDAAARELLAAAGYGDFFIHRTGHGIGLDVHEDPYIVDGNDLVLEPGMAFSIEPGVYLPGRFGTRIEDIVVVTEDGGERLNVGERRAVSV